jgi:F0F1-type ATP synthase membrane subunit c/vacuolar-type H+-ATPase subunit K
MMITNNFFSLERYFLLCKKDFKESWKTMLLRFVMVYAILTILFVFFSFDQSSNLNEESYLQYYSSSIFLFWGWGCVFASLMMGEMSTKAKRISYLMTPATVFEKYISRLVIAVVLFIIAFLIAFKMADYTRLAICLIRYPELKFHSLDLIGFIGHKSLIVNWLDFFYRFSIYLFFQSLFVLGSTLWYKKPFLKTLAAGAIISLVFVIVDGTLIHFLFKDGIVDFSHSMEYYSFNTHNLFSTKTCMTFFFLVTLFNWTLAYFRFKDSEIINRI